MKISTKGRYALRLMLDIALSEGENPVRIKDISERQGISVKYLEQIISILHKAGFVRSIRGAKGGYYLTKKPDDYTVGDILRLTEGSMAPVDCVVGGSDYCDRANECVTYILWEKLYDAISGVIDHITLEDLKTWYYDKAGNNYVI
ncbi:MAG: Rrf2 family transcriptional regulator [Lachnospiraceae bacterium]|nr:Rrf2 family transcriptional regulator [Lachnospiraceae bacterium]